MLEQGTKRKMQDLEQSYKQLGMDVAVVDEQQYVWKSLHPEAPDQEHEQAKAADLQRSSSSRRISRSAKPREIIAKSYDLLFREKVYINFANCNLSCFMSYEPIDNHGC